MAISRNEFWSIVEEGITTGKKDPHYLEEKLRQMPLEKFLWFAYWFDLAMYESNLKKLNEYAERAFGSECGHDAFMDFRYWLLSEGRETFEYALANPEELDGYLETPSYGGFVSCTAGVFNDRIDEAEVPKEQWPPRIPDTIGYIDQRDEA